MHIDVGCHASCEATTRMKSIVVAHTATATAVVVVAATVAAATHAPDGDGRVNALLIAARVPERPRDSQSRG